MYDEKAQRCNILVFDYHRAETEAVRISRETSNRGRKHPVYRFYDANNAYIPSLRYRNLGEEAQTHSTFPSQIPSPSTPSKNLAVHRLCQTFIFIL